MMVPNVFAETYTVEFAPDGDPGCQDTDECFIPYQLSIDAGDTVQFVNTGYTAAHAVTSGTPADGPSGVFDSGFIPIGDTFSTTFDTNGTYPYYCMLHPWTAGIIIVGDGISKTSEPESTAEVESGVDQTDDSLTMFERKKTDILSSLGYNQGFPYHFGLEKDFPEDLKRKANYQLYKIIESQTNKHVGDLKFYLGSSEWWDENAVLQEDDTSGFENIFKVKIFLMHKTEPVMIQQMINHLITALQILVPEWSNELDDILDNWFVGSINFSERNENGKRENSIRTENKEIKVLHDDLDYGSITVIVTENTDTISLGSISTESDILDELLSAEESESSVVEAPKSEQKEILSFVDSSKGAEHYVERYTTEPDYKAWFDRNFPDYTIYEGIGITESQYQKIVNQLTKPQPVAEQKVTVQTSTGGNEIIYVLIAVVAVGGGIGAIFIIKKGSKPSTTVQRESPSRRQKTVLFCGKCGSSLIPGARFCGKCGNPHS